MQGIVGNTNHVEKVTHRNVAAALVAINKSMKNMSLLSLKDMEDLSRQAWQINNAYHSKIEKLEREKAALKGQLDTMWHLIEKLLYPALGISDPMLKVYEELIALKNILGIIRNCPELFVTSEAREASLLDVQERLGKVENDNLVNGAFLPGKNTISNANVPSGQALCFNLVNSCHHDIRVIQNSLRNDAPTTKLESVNYALINLLAILHSGCDYDPETLASLMAELQDIEQSFGKHAKSESEVGTDRNLALKQIEVAHDMIFECLQVMKEDSSEEMLLLYDQVSLARNQLLDQMNMPMEELESLSSSMFTNILNPVTNALHYLEGSVENAVKSGSSKLYSVVQSAYGLASSLLQTKEKSNQPETEKIKAAVNDITNGFKAMRNKQTQAIFAQSTTPKEANEALTIESENLGKQLQQIEENNAELIGKSQSLAIAIQQCKAALKSF
jgi:hypothetical protein